MYCTKQVTEDLTWVGADDRRLAMFEGVYSVPRGVSYNAYLLADEATVLFDTVDKAVSRVFFENVAHALNGRKLDYVVVHHMEPDHSATLEELLLRWPEATIVCSAMAAAMIRQFFGDENFPVRVVGEGDTLRTGRHELRFAMTPMVHWPEVMVTFDTADRTLFTADAFGCFGALNGALFADEVDFARDYLDEARRYYCNIVGKYGAQVQVLLQKAAALAPARLCPLHGFVWRKDLGYYLDKYQAWSSYIPEEAGVLIVYASIYGNTENAANILACRLRDRGVQTALYDVSVTPASEILAAAFRYSHLVFASATYNAGVFLSMDALLRDLAAHNLQNRTVALIQNGSWAPASGSQMQKLLAGCKNMTFLEKTVTVKSSVQAVQNAELDALAEELSAALPAASAAAPVPAGPVDAAAVRALTYGLFVLTARDGGRDNGCIVNTAQQITTSPVRLTLAVNKRNYTHDLIRRTGLFNLSVLTQDAPFSVFEQFGFSSGRDTDKFARGPALPRTANGLVYLPEHANAVLSARVTAVQDCGTHTLFVAEVTEARVLSQAPSATYAYYLERIKPKPEDKKPAPGHKVWVCAICGYVYDEAKEGVPFEELPADWTCPWCKHPKSDFRQKG